MGSNNKIPLTTLASQLREDAESLEDEILFNDVGVADKGFTRKDQREMQRLGKKQELLRNFRPLSAFSFTVLIQASWEFLLMYAVFLLTFNEWTD